jgi:murein DD-endopeptidase MepM/ murein hydrolase activator NlpD
VPRSRTLSPRALAAVGAIAAVAVVGAGVSTEAAAPTASAIGWTTSDHLAVVDDSALPDLYTDGAPMAVSGAVRGATQQVELRTAEQIRQEEAARALKERKRKAAARAAARKAARQAWVSQFTLPIRNFQLSARFGEGGGNWSSRHTGLDFRAPYGTSVYAASNGRVARVTYHPAYGTTIVLDIGRGITLWYCHLSSVTVSQGDKVDVGERIGAVGTSGNTTGSHLHFEVRKWDQPTDPAKFLFAKTPGYTAAAPSWVYSGPIERLSGL